MTEQEIRKMLNDINIDWNYGDTMVDLEDLDLVAKALHQKHKQSLIEARIDELENYYIIEDEMCDVAKARLEELKKQLD